MQSSDAVGLGVGCACRRVRVPAQTCASPRRRRGPVRTVVGMSVGGAVGASVGARVGAALVGDADGIPVVGAGVAMGAVGAAVVGFTGGADTSATRAAVGAADAPTEGAAVLSVGVAVGDSVHAHGSVSPHSLRTCVKHSAAAGAVAACPLRRVAGGYRHIADAAVIAQPTREHRQRLRRAAAAALPAEYARRRRRENTHRVERVADLRRARAVDLGAPHLPHGAGPPTSECAADQPRALARQRQGACGGGSRLSSRGGERRCHVAGCAPREFSCAARHTAPTRSASRMHAPTRFVPLQCPQIQHRATALKRHPFTSVPPNAPPLEYPLARSGCAPACSSSRPALGPP